MWDPKREAFIGGYLSPNPIGDEWQNIHSKVSASPVFAEKNTNNNANKNRTFFIITT
jgi:hypothetical protein